jgi:hypothetical protein
MKRTVGILVLVAVVGSPAGLLAAPASPVAHDQQASPGVETSGEVSEDQAITWTTRHADLRADAIRLQVGDGLLRPPGDARVQEWMPAEDHLEMRARWYEVGARHELYLAFEPSDEGWTISAASYLQDSPGVRAPGTARSPIEFAIPRDGTETPDSSAGGQLRATARVPVAACDGTQDAVADASLEVDGLTLAVSPPQWDLLLEVGRALLGRVPEAPGDWLGQDGYTGPPVSVACPPPIAGTLEDETIALSRPDDPDGMTAGLVTEEVAPGVFLVQSDGIRDLRSEPLVSCESLAWSVDAPPLDQGSLDVDESSLGRVVAGLDGSIWLFWADRFVRLRDVTTHRWAEGQAAADRNDLEVAPDGTVWQAPASGSRVARTTDEIARAQAYLDQLRSTPEAFAARPECLTDTGWLTGTDGALRAYRDGEWQVALESPSLPIRQVEIAIDDSIWAGWSERSTGGAFAPQAARLGADGWQVIVPPDEQVDASRAFAALGDGSIIMQARGRSGALWSLGDVTSGQIGPWQPVASRRGLDDVVASPSGIIWGTLMPNTIARLDAVGWQEWDLGGVTDPAGPRFLGGGGPLAAGQDGAVWLQARPTKAAHGCHGVYRFDGTTWRHFLDGHCVHSIDVAPNGWVWLRAAPDLGDDVEGPVDLYAIRPDASGA